MLSRIYEEITILVNIVIELAQLFGAVLRVLFEVVPPKEKSVQGEVVLVTETGHGVGRELALNFARLGAAVACVDINEAGNWETVRIIKEKTGATAHSYKCDVLKRKEVFAVVAKIRENIGPVTVLANITGIMPCKDKLKYSPEEIRKIYNFNMMAHYWLFEATLPYMMETNHGHVVALIPYIPGAWEIVNHVPPGAMKFAVRGMMAAYSTKLRKSARKTNVKFTTIYPYALSASLSITTRLGTLDAESFAEETVKAMRRNYY